MKTFTELAQFYVAYHKNPMTRYTHFVGIPLVILSFMILLGFVKIIIPGVLGISLAFLATLVALYFYFKLNWQLALALTPILFILLWISSWFSYAGPTKLGVWAFIITSVLGWGAQFYGHMIEGRRPALMDNLMQSLIAPLFLMAELFFMAGLMKPLKEEIYSVVVEESKE